MDEPDTRTVGYGPGPVELPDVDTNLLLRPTEARTLWPHEFGGALRYRPGRTLRCLAALPMDPYAWRDGWGASWP